MPKVFCLLKCLIRCIIIDLNGAMKCMHVHVQKVAVEVAVTVSFSRRGKMIEVERCLIEGV